MKWFICLVSHKDLYGRTQSQMYTRASNALEAKLWALAHLEQTAKNGNQLKLLWIEEDRR